MNVVWIKVNYLLKPRSDVYRVTEIKIDGLDVKGVALADKFNEFFVELVQSLHSEDASKYVLGANDSLFLFRTDESEMLSVFKN